MSIKKKSILIIAMVIVLFTATIFVACEKKEKKFTELLNLRAEDLVRIEYSIISDNGNKVVTSLVNIKNKELVNSIMTELSKIKCVKTKKPPTATYTFRIRFFTETPSNLSVEYPGDKLEQCKYIEYKYNQGFTGQNVETSHYKGYCLASSNPALIFNDIK